MSANEITNHIEAACWLRFGPLADPLIDPPPLFFRSQSGFIDRIGVYDLTDPLFVPACFLQLDRYYTRQETVLMAFVPTTGDIDDGTLALRPSGALGTLPITPTVIPMDSRIVYGEIAATDEAVAAGLEAFNGFIINPWGVSIPLEGSPELVPSYYDLCIQLIRTPRRTPAVTYKQFSFVPPSP